MAQIDNQAVNDLVDYASLGPVKRKISKYSDKADSAASAVKDAWEGSPLKQAYNKYAAKDDKKYVPGAREKALGFSAKNNSPTKKAPQRKRVAGK